MRIVELTGPQFDEFSSKNQLNSFYQTSKYAILMTNHGYSYDLIGYVDENDNNRIVAATLVLNKIITGKVRYGYCPKGFLIDYYDQNLTQQFLIDLKAYYKTKGYIFIKFDPEVIIGTIDAKNKFQINYNGNVRIIDYLKSLGIKRRKEQQEFELMHPKYQAYIDLKSFSFEKINRNYRKKIRKCINEGMQISLGGPKDIDIFYEFIKDKTNKPITYYRDLYNVFSKDNSIDLIFVKANYQKYLEFVRDQYSKEEQLNFEWNELIAQNPKKSNITAKMNSDNKLQGYKEKIVQATEGLKKHSEAIVAAALVVKHHGIITIVDSGYGDEFKNLNPNHFLYYSIFERYKPFFNFCNIGGISSFDDNAQFKGVNTYKLNWRPLLFEYIGEFDLVCSEYYFKKLINSSYIEKEFTNSPINKNAQ